jgi:hypothetical protein
MNAAQLIALKAVCRGCANCGALTKADGDMCRLCGGRLGIDPGSCDHEFGSLVQFLHQAVGIYEQSFKDTRLLTGTCSRCLSDVSYEIAPAMHGDLQFVIKRDRRT